MINNSLTAILVDDEKAAIDYLSGLLAGSNRISILGTFTNPEEAIYKILSDKPDILFLDIQMPQKNGFDVIKEIRSDEYHPWIVFTTAFINYSIQAIRHAAFDYLLKPVEKSELDAVLSRIDKDYKKGETSSKVDLLFEKLNTSRKLKFNTSSGFILINTDDIIYCEADGNYCGIYMTNDRYELVTNNMKTVANQLPEHVFARISRFHIINTNFLSKVERKNHTCTLNIDNKKIQLKGALSYLKELERKFDTITT